MASRRWQPHVLVVDGSRPVLDLFHDLLVGEGYRVSLLTHPDADVEGIKRLGPDLIVLDLVFAGADSGWRLLEQLLWDEDTATIPIVVCSGAVHVVHRVADQLRDLGIPVVLKPFDVDELLRAVAGALACAGRAIAVGMPVGIDHAGSQAR